MKIGLIVPANTNISPYIQYYITFFKQLNLDYKVIVWNKKGEEDSADYKYNFRTEDDKRLRILYGHAVFAQRCRYIIKKECIDHLVVFTIAPLFFLGKNYLSRFKFIADIRDDSPFRRHFANYLRQISEKSFMTVVSSPRYAMWFSKSILCHNANKTTLFESLKYNPSLANKENVRIVFAGILIEPDQNIKILEEMKNDDRFKFIFIGKDNAGKKKLKHYVAEHEIRNVEFLGEYQKSQIVGIYRETADLINIFREKSQINKDALPNKLYDAVMAGIPVAVFSHNEAITDYVNSYNLGIVLEDTGKIGESIREKYEKFDFEKYQKGRHDFLKLVLSDLERFEAMLSEFTR